MKMAISRKIEQSEYFENEQLISFQTGTRFCERVKRILLKSPSRIIKVVRLLSYKGSDKILDLYLHSVSEIVSEYNFCVC